MSSLRPAGISNRTKSNEPKGRKPAGGNVEAFLSREVEIHNAKSYTRANELQAYKAHWEEQQVRKLSQNGKARDQKIMEEELELANKEVKMVRAARLKQFYSDSYSKWQEELHERGLSLIKDRA